MKKAPTTSENCCNRILLFVAAIQPSEGGLEHDWRLQLQV